MSHVASEKMEELKRRGGRARGGGRPRQTSTIECDKRSVQMT